MTRKKRKTFKKKANSGIKFTLTNANTQTYLLHTFTY